MIEDDETCGVAFRMAALEEMLADRIEATLPASTIQQGTEPWVRKMAAVAARIRARELLDLACEYSTVQLAVEDAEGESLQ